MNWDMITVAIGAIIGFLTFLYGILKPTSKNDSQSSADDWKHNVLMEQALIKEQIDNIRKEVDGLKKNIQANDEKTIRSLERFESRIEKFTDIIIDHLSKD